MDFLTLSTVIASIVFLVSMTILLIMIFASKNNRYYKKLDKWRKNNVNKYGKN